MATALRLRLAILTLPGQNAKAAILSMPERRLHPASKLGVLPVSGCSAMM